MQQLDKLRMSAVLVFLGGASYGVVSPLIKLAYAGGYSFADVTVAQFYYSAAMLWIVVALTVWPNRKKLSMTWKNFLRIALLGVIGTTTSITYYKALTGLPAWLGVILLFQFAWMTFFVEYIFTKKRPNRFQWVGIVTIVLGTIIANAGDFHSALHITWLGILYGILSGVSYSLFLFLNAGVDTSSPPLYRSAIIATVSSLVITLVFPLHATFIHESVKGLWVYGLLIGLFSQAIPTTMFAIGIPRLGGGTAAILSSAELPVAVILASLLLGESILWTGWTGVILIFAGIIVGNRKS